MVGDVLLDRRRRRQRVTGSARTPRCRWSTSRRRWPGRAAPAWPPRCSPQDGLDVTLVAPVGRRRAPGAACRRCSPSGGAAAAAAAPTARTRGEVRVRVRASRCVRLDSGTAVRAVGRLPDAVLDALAHGRRGAGVRLRPGGTPADPAVRSALAAAATARPVVWDPHQRGEPTGARRPAGDAERARGGARWRPAGARATSPSGRGPPRARRTARRRGRPHAVCVTLGDRGALLAYGSGAPLVVPAERVERRGPLRRRGPVRRHRRRRPGRRRGGVARPSSRRSPRRRCSSRRVARQCVPSARCRPTVAGRPVGRPVGPTGAARVDRVRAAGGTVVATGGCFDLLHAGHVGTAARRPRARGLPGRLPQLRRLGAPAEGAGPAAGPGGGPGPRARGAGVRRRGASSSTRTPPSGAARRAAAGRVGEGRRLRAVRPARGRGRVAAGTARPSSCPTWTAGRPRH